MSETRDPILENMEAFYKECHAQVREMREKLKIATVANEQFKADLHHRDAEIAQLREKLAAVRGIFLEWTDADSIGEWCHDCETEGFIGKLQHSQSCRVGRAIAIIDGKEANDES